MRAPGDHKTNSAVAAQRASRAPLGPLRRTAYREAASHPGPPASAALSRPPQGTKPPQPSPSPLARPPRLLESKDARDRIIMLPESLKTPLQYHLFPRKVKRTEYPTSATYADRCNHCCAGSARR